jgi:hypothetical protein
MAVGSDRRLQVHHCSVDFFFIELKMF